MFVDWVIVGLLCLCVYQLNRIREAVSKPPQSFWDSLLERQEFFADIKRIKERLWNIQQGQRE